MSNNPPPKSYSYEAAGVSIAAGNAEDIDAGYQILVTADHGMNADRSHNGLLPEEREVPLIVLGDAFSLDPAARPQQTELCGTVCQLLGVAHDKPWCRELLA